ncbi:MAG: 2-hydroxyacyl-CoA dehydratase family protein [Desulfobulbaceae bacterium]|nr:2-hydroxyacyl-CoA dehydratase family protein [Desulfobulbaceae bacterium]
MNSSATERTATPPPDRKQRLRAKITRETAAEYAEAARSLRAHPDYNAVWDNFLAIIEQPQSARQIERRTARPVVEHLCNQAPLEIAHALGLQPLRLASGCCAASRLADASLPALMCPLMRSTLGMRALLAADDESNAAATLRIIPTTCDWTVKFPELAGESDKTRAHFLELPHLRHSERGQARFQEELFILIEELEKTAARRLTRAALRASIDLYRQAWAVFAEFIALRRDGRLAAVWFMVVCAAFMADTVEHWLAAAAPILAHLQKESRRVVGNAVFVFLSGSPLLFPNLKILRLIEEAGLYVLADDLCASERLWPGGLTISDPSFSGLIRALAGRYHRACQCPTFADNQRRFNTIRASGLRPRGIIHHVLKGCHPFDIESLTMEREAAKAGIPFIRIETEYSPEDARTLLTRLEAFAHIDQGAMK